MLDTLKQVPHPRADTELLVRAMYTYNNIHKYTYEYKPTKGGVLSRLVLSPISNKEVQFASSSD